MIEMVSSARVFILGLSLAAANLAHGERLEFTAPPFVFPYTSLTWPAINGFQFNPYWAANNDRDTRNAPWIPGNQAAITSTFGPFTFNSIELGGWPYDNFDINLFHASIPLVFYDGSGRIAAIRYVDLGSDNTFSTFAEAIPDVATIAIGSASFSSLGIRLGAVTINETRSVPEPTTFFLFSVAGLALLAARRLRNSG